MSPPAFIVFQNLFYLCKAVVTSRSCCELFADSQKTVVHRTPRPPACPAFLPSPMMSPLGTSLITCLGYALKFRSQNLLVFRGGLLHPP